MRHRNVMESNFGSLSSDGADDTNPMEGLGNLADVMLVFACGLMLALVVKYNLDIAPSTVEVQESEDLTQMDGDVENGQTTMSESGAGYEELGVVYRDPKTGKMYMLESDAKK